MEFLIRHLRPEGLILRTCVKTQEQADELLDNAVKWCGTDVHKKKGYQKKMTSRDKNLLKIENRNE